MMALPYQCLSTLGKSTILCGSKGTSIYTFDLGSYTLLSSWTHPLSEKSESKVDVNQTGQDGGQESEQQQQPPSKKRRIEPNGGGDVGEGQAPEAPAESTDAAANGNDNGNGNGNGKKQGKKQKSKHTGPRPQEQPFIILITTTSDSSYVVAVTGSDKTVWVLEHDGKGGLKELSQRAMPKRPSSITLTADGKTILCADKFGDVYSLPLIPSTSSISETAKASSPVDAPTAQISNKPKGANKFTVHSKRNLRALEDQERSRNGTSDTPKEGPSFEHELILGHVSMLTAIELATLNDRSYILTANRDEQIRISRGIPQAYVIENFCLGHNAFIGALCIPPSQPELLVSGGGDDELYLWDWLAGKLLNKVDLLSYVQEEVAPDAQKVAVSGLYCYETREGCNIVAICERVPALFIFKLHHNTLVHVQTTQLSGNPLDVAIISTGAQPLTLAVAVDPAPSTAEAVTEGGVGALDSSLLTLVVEDGGSVSSPEMHLPVVETVGMDISRAELDKIFYTMENLRKTDTDNDGGNDKSVKEPVAEHEQAEAEPMDVGEGA